MDTWKLVACDLDGTLMRDDMSVSEENLYAIAQTAELDVEFVPCSGRTLCEIPEKVRNHPGVHWIIHSNGAVILDRRNGQRYPACMTREVAGRVLDLLYACDTHITIRQGGQSYADAAHQTPEDYVHNRVYAAHRSVLADYAVMLDNYKERIYAMEDIEVISVFFHSDQEMAACWKTLEESGEVTVVSTAAVHLEIMAASAGKGNALRRLCRILDISPAETIGMGDSGNDLPLMRASGLALAMGNGSEVLKKEADAVICRNDEHAVRYVLEKYLRCKA